MSFKIACLILAFVAFVAVYADEHHGFKHLRRDWGVEEVKKKIDEYLEKVSRDHVISRLEAGISYLKGLSGPLEDVPRFVEQVFKKFNEEQKEQLLKYLENLKQK